MSHKIKTILTRYFRLGCFFAFCEYAQLGEVEEPALDFDTPVDVVGQVEDGRLEFPLDHELDGLDLVRPEVTGQLLRAEGDFLGRGKGATSKGTREVFAFSWLHSYRNSRILSSARRICIARLRTLWLGRARPTEAVTGQEWGLTSSLFLHSS